MYYRSGKSGKRAENMALCLHILAYHLYTALPKLIINADANSAMYENFHSKYVHLYVESAYKESIKVSKTILLAFLGSTEQV